MTSRPAVTVVFFDDYPLQSENLIFVERLKRKLADWRIHVEVQKTFHLIEECLRKEDADVIILDIMARAPQAHGAERAISSSLAGVEVLRRCRAGNYGTLNQRTPIFMRTARGEPHVRKAGLQAGATDFFIVGTEDDRLILSIRLVLEKRDA